MVQYAIEARSGRRESMRRGWDTDGVGDQNVFDSIAEAEEAIEELQCLGSDWEMAEYRVVPIEE